MRKLLVAVVFLAVVTAAAWAQTSRIGHKYPRGKGLADPHLNFNIISGQYSQATVVGGAIMGVKANAPYGGVIRATLTSGQVVDFYELPGTQVLGANVASFEDGVALCDLANRIVSVEFLNEDPEGGVFENIQIFHCEGNSITEEDWLALTGG